MKAFGNITVWAFLLIFAVAAPNVLAQSGDTPPSSAPLLVLTDDQDQYSLGLYLETYVHDKKVKEI
jgi:hypothetical protein